MTWTALPDVAELRLSVSLVALSGKSTVLSMIRVRATNVQRKRENGIPYAIGAFWVLGTCSSQTKEPEYAISLAQRQQRLW